MHSIDELPIIKSRRSEIHKQQSEITEVSNDILLLLFEKLDWIDRFRSATVCKNWFQLMSKIPYQPNQGKFPWQFSHLIYETNEIDCVAKLIDESSKRTYIIESYIWSDHEIMELLCGATACASKFGWILMAKEIPKSKTVKFFIFCPFNRKLLKLPFFYVHDANITVNRFEAATFSSNPSSPYCVFFVVSSDLQMIEIRTCRIGDNEWKNFRLSLTIPFINRHDRCHAEFVNGLLYVVFYDTNTQDIYVSTFKVETEEWRLMENDGKKLGRPIMDAKCVLRLVSYDHKELYLACMTIKGEVWEVSKFDMENNEWVEQISLGNRVLFIGCSSFLVDAVGEMSDLADYAFSDCYGSPSYPFSFTSKRIQSDRQFYVDSLELYNCCFRSTWITPSI